MPSERLKYSVTADPNSHELFARYSWAFFVFENGQLNASEMNEEPCENLPLVVSLQLNLRILRLMYCDQVVLRPLR